MPRISFARERCVWTNRFSSPLDRLPAHFALQASRSSSFRRFKRFEKAVQSAPGERDARFFKIYPAPESAGRHVPTGMLETAPAGPGTRLTRRRRLTQRQFDASILIHTGDVCLGEPLFVATGPSAREFRRRSASFVLVSMLRTLRGEGPERAGRERRSIFQKLPGTGVRSP